MIEAHLNIPKKDFVQEPKLLAHPNIPRGLHGLAPRAILGELWWEKTKEQARRSTQYHCKACGRHRSEDRFYNWVECHEVYWIDYIKKVSIFKRVVPLCHSCHSFIHSGRLIVMYEEGKIKKEDGQRIIEHGFDLCNRFGVAPYFVAAEAAYVFDMTEDKIKFPPMWEPPKFNSSGEWKLDIFGTYFTASDIE